MHLSYETFEIKPALPQPNYIPEFPPLNKKSQMLVGDQTMLIVDP
jgi:hypothetical protein